MSKKFKSNKVELVGSLTGLEKYIEQVHEQQITDYERLKKITTDTALGMNKESSSTAKEKP